MNPNQVREALTPVEPALPPFKPIGPDADSFEKVDRFARNLFDKGMADIRARRLKVSPSTLALLETLEGCVKSYPREAGSQFAQEGAFIVANVRAGARS